MKDKIKIAQKELCYKSLAYCCGLEKPCYDRNKAIKELGLTKKEYKILKDNFDITLKRSVR